MKVTDAWRKLARWLAVKPHQFDGPPISSSKTHVREWHRRQREALREAYRREVRPKEGGGERPD
jgi:hypothetical protein